jgi:cytochrome c-type biogenesis protein CcmH
MRNLRLIFLSVLVVLAPFAHAGEAAPVAQDPVLEARVMKLAEELRCLVCQNQTIAESHADLAIDLRNQIREKLKQGMSEKEVKAYMVQRYGDFVLYRPPVKATTWLLWFGPFILLVAGVAVLFTKLKTRARKVAEAKQLSEADHRRAQELLGGDEKPEGT